MAIGASGSQLTYQWQRDGKPIAGDPSASTPTRTLANLQRSDAGSYTALVVNAGGSVTSVPVTLNVSDTPVPPPPAITTQPADTTVTLGGSASFFVVATGNQLVYRWFKNGVLIPDANAARLTFQNAGIGHSAQYSVVVSNSSGSISSSSATLLVVSEI